MTVWDVRCVFVPIVVALGRRAARNLSQWLKRSKASPMLQMYVSRMEWDEFGLLGRS